MKDSVQNWKTCYRRFARDQLYSHNLYCLFYRLMIGKNIKQLCKASDFPALNVWNVVFHLFNNFPITFQDSSEINILGFFHFYNSKSIKPHNKYRHTTGSCWSERIGSQFIKTSNSTVDCFVCKKLPLNRTGQVNSSFQSGYYPHPGDANQNNVNLSFILLPTRVCYLIAFRCLAYFQIWFILWVK